MKPTTQPIAAPKPEWLVKPWAVYEHEDHSGLCIGVPYSEPWMTRDDETDPGFRTEYPDMTISGSGGSVTDDKRAMANHAAACHNALLGIADPAGALRVAREALKHARQIAIFANDVRIFDDAIKALTPAEKGSK